MRKAPVHLLVLFTLVMALAAPARADVLISELCDPRDNYLSDRFIEIYNSGPAAVDLGGWSVTALGNGSPIFTWNLSGSIAAGEALVLAGDSPVVNFPVDFPQAAWATSNSTWNGKVGDGAELHDGGQLIDRVEAPGVLFENADLVRNENVLTASTSFNAAEWTATAVDLPTEGTPGLHNAPIPDQGPTITGVVATPADPLPGQAVDVSATVTDASHAITGVNLEWGLSAAALVNTIPMALQGGDTWATTSGVPGQANGTTVHYRVTADNDAPATGTSATASYSVYVDLAAPAVISLLAEGPTAVLVTFNEALDPASAGDPANYAVSGSSVVAAVLQAGAQAVRLTVSTLASGSHTLAVDGVEDLSGNAVSGLVAPFEYYGANIPPGYYDGTVGQTGATLQSTLHAIIDNHDNQSYTSLWGHFYTTDVKPNGKVWDMYSDVPGGTPPYEYTLGVDQVGSGATEGTGYNREHSWPSSWYGDSSPMNTDLFVIYPTDTRVNGMRSNYPFGEVGTATWTSLNGSQVGSCAYPGYTGTVFEPIDEYKGDFARSYFYMGARYYGEDGSWSGSPMVDGAQLLPWAEAMLLEWHAADPVSQKEIDRNEAVYAIQNNRNPFIDRPDFVARVYQADLADVPGAAVAGRVELYQNAPNPFNPATTISYDLPEAGRVTLQVFDLSGRLVRTLQAGHREAGRHQEIWRGRDEDGRLAAAGVYFYRLRTERGSEARRMTLLK